MLSEPLLTRPRTHTHGFLSVVQKEYFELLKEYRALSPDPRMWNNIGVIDGCAYVCFKSEICSTSSPSIYDCALAPSADSLTILFKPTITAHEGSCDSSPSPSQAVFRCEFSSSFYCKNQQQQVDRRVIVCVQPM